MRPIGYLACLMVSSLCFGSVSCPWRHFVIMGFVPWLPLLQFLHRPDRTSELFPSVIGFFVVLLLLASFSGSIITFHRSPAKASLTAFYHCRWYGDVPWTNYGVHLIRLRWFLGGRDANLAFLFHVSVGIRGLCLPLAFAFTLWNSPLMRISSSLV